MASFRCLTLVSVTATILAAAVVAVADAATADSDWGYVAGVNGPDTWPEKFPEFCAGIFQSPVDLNGRSSVANFNKPLAFSAGYLGGLSQRPRPWLSGSLSNDGLSVKFTPDKGQTAAYEVSGGVVQGSRYRLLQAHFHWGSTSLQGSEHTLEGQSFPLELHAVHVNTRYATTEEALLASDGLLVLGFLFYVPALDSDTRAFKPLRAFESAMAKIVSRAAGGGKSQFDVKVPIRIDLSQFLEAVNKNSFYHYSGSLTTPGCNEVVTWIVFDRAIAIGDHQLKAFRKLKSKDGGTLVDNFRPTQPLNGRKVYHHVDQDLSLHAMAAATNKVNDYSSSIRHVDQDLSLHAMAMAATNQDSDYSSSSIRHVDQDHLSLHAMATNQDSDYSSSIHEHVISQPPSPSPAYHP